MIRCGAETAMSELRERIENHVALGPDVSPGFFLSDRDLKEIAMALRLVSGYPHVGSMTPAELHDEVVKLRAALTKIVKVEGESDPAILWPWAQEVATEALGRSLGE